MPPTARRPTPPVDDTMVVPAAAIVEADALAAAAPASRRGRPRPAAARLAGDRGARRADRRCSSGGGSPADRYRNRELLYLAVVGVLTGIGFASVYIARQSVVSWGSLGYAALLLRRSTSPRTSSRASTVPNADPYLLPMAGAPDRGRRDRDLPARPGRRVQAGALDRDRRRPLRARAPPAAARLPRARAATSTSSAIGAIVLLFLPRVPGLGTTVNGARLWVHVGPLHVPAGRAREDLPDRLPRRATCARSARCSRRRALKDVGPLLVIWGGCMLVLVVVERPRLGAPLLRDLPRDALHRDGAALVRARAASASSRAGGFVAYEKIPHVHERVTIWLHPWTTHEGLLPVRPAASRCGRTARATSSSSRSTRSATAASAAPGSARGRSRRPTATR